MVVAERSVDVATQKEPKLYNERRLIEGMDAARLDALVAFSPDNFYYISSSYMTMWSAAAMRDRVGIAVVPRTGDPFLLASAVEESNLRRFTPIEDIRFYSFFQESPAEVLADQLIQGGFGSATIGIEKKYCTAFYYDQLARALPGATLVDGDKVFERARNVKTQVEIDRLYGAARGTDRAIYTAMEMAKEGDTELDVVSQMISNLARIGGGEFKTVTWGVAGGENVLTTHYSGGQRPIAHGDQVRVNLRATWGGYFSHLYRNAWVHEVPARHADVYKRYRELYAATIDLMRPGNRCCDVYDQIMKMAGEIGLTCKGAHVGHSTGVPLHENPYLRPGETTVLEPGMVIAVEPTAIEAGFGIYHLEDLVLITEKDPVVLSDYTNTEQPFIIR